MATPGGDKSQPASFDMSPMTLPQPVSVTSPEVKPLAASGGDAAAAAAPLSAAGSLSSFLESFGAATPSAGSTIGVGVVRGRGTSSAKSELLSPTKPSASAFASTDPAIASKLTEGVKRWTASVPVSSVTKATPAPKTQPGSVTLVDVQDRLAVAVDAVTKNANTKVLIVEANYAQAVTTLAELSSTHASLQSTFALWDGNIRQPGDDSSRLVVTHLHSYFLMILTPPKAPCVSALGDITHVLFGLSLGESRATMCDTCLNATLQLAPAVLANVHLVLFGDHISQTQLAATGRPVVDLRRPIPADVMNLHFSPDESASLAENMSVDLSSIVTHSTATVAHIAIPAKITDQLVDMTLKLVVKIQKAKHDVASRTRVVGVIFTAEPHHILGRIQGRRSPHCVYTNDCKFFTTTEELDAWIAADKGGFGAAFLLADSCPVAYLPHGAEGDAAAGAPSRGFPQSLMQHVNVIVDLGTERRLGPTPKQEFPFLVRHSLPTSSREAAARDAFLATLPSQLQQPTILRFRLTHQPPSVDAITAPVSAMEAVLQVTRLDGRPQLLSEPISHVDATQRTEYVNFGLTRLAELCTIASPITAGITFVGDLLARIPLSLENAFIVMHGLVTGLHDAFTLVASVLQHPLRPSSMTAAAADAVSHVLKAVAGVARCSDAVVDALLILKALALPEGTARNDFLAQICVTPAAFQAVLQTYQRVLRHCTDYLVDRTVGVGHTLAMKRPERVLQQLTDNIHAITFVVAVSHASKACIVRSERDDRLNLKERASLMFLRTSKDVAMHSFVPSVVEWKTGNVVVCASLVNATGRMFGASHTTTSYRNFANALALLSPTLEFDQVSPQSVEFAVTVNRQTRRYSTDLASSARILDCRERFNRLLGSVMLRRSSPTTSLTAFLSLMAQQKMDIEAERAHYLASLASVSDDVELTEVSFNALPVPLSRSLHLAPAAVHDLPTLAIASDVSLAHSVRTAVAAGRKTGVSTLFVDPVLESGASTPAKLATPPSEVASASAVSSHAPRGAAAGNFHLTSAIAEDGEDSDDSDDVADVIDEDDEGALAKGSRHIIDED